ncbi:MAG: hypothetical protein DRI93_06895 [Aquificota bacterium]|nr:MAG: hypothetical protein DRI93_06895 [Aquificota bacterium]
MVEELLSDTKLIPVPKALADQIRHQAARLGLSVSAITAESLRNFLKAHQLGATLGEAVDLVRLSQVHRGAGHLALQRAGFKDLVKTLYAEDPSTLRRLWRQSGRWYAAYLSSKLGEDLLGFLEKDLLLTWNLDESQVEVEDLAVRVRLVSFDMSEVLTELLVVYTKGFFEELGYACESEDVLPGLVYMEFLRKQGARL